MSTAVPTLADTTLREIAVAIAELRFGTEPLEQLWEKLMPERKMLSNLHFFRSLPNDDVRESTARFVLTAMLAATRASRATTPTTFKLSDLRTVADRAVLDVDFLDANDAGDIADWFIEQLIRGLRRDPRMPRLQWHDWELALADLRGQLTSGIAEFIDRRDNPFDIARRVVDALVDMAWTCSPMHKGGRR